MSQYFVGLVEGFLLANNANQHVMAAFQGIISQPKEAVFDSDIPAHKSEVKIPEKKPEALPAVDGKIGWSRWTTDETDKILDTVRQWRAMGKKTGDIIKEIMRLFPKRKYNAVYTKMMALDLISDTKPDPKKKPVKKAQEEEETGEA